MAKKSKKPLSAESESKNRGEKTAKNAQDEDRKAARQLHRAKVASTSSWTGKLPHTLLHENCQKRKWNKVEYDMKKIGEKGFVGTAVLSWTDPKSTEEIKIRMGDPTYDKSTGKGAVECQETAIEARHYAATVALCRIAFNTNLHMMLPPNHKAIWYKLDDYRKELENRNKRLAATLFDVDPFKTCLEERKVNQLKEKERLAKVQHEDKKSKTPLTLTSLRTKSEPKGNRKPVLASKIIRENRAVRFPAKVWERAAFIDLNESSRNLIEDFLRSRIDWDAKESKNPATKVRESLRNEILSFGFRKAHVDEAMHYEDPLSFLLLNLPEDDLPPFFRKRREDSKTRVEVASLPLKQSNMIDRLLEGGYSYDECLYALETCNFNENEAVGFLTMKYAPGLNAEEFNDDDEESNEIWLQELESFESIYGSDTVETFTKDRDVYNVNLSQEFGIKLRIYKTKHYPRTLPGVIVSTFDKNIKIPNYIKQTILSKMIHHITKSGLLGDILVFHMFEWLQDNLATIIENPGSLLTEEERRGSYKDPGKKGDDKIRGTARKRHIRDSDLSEGEIERIKAMINDRSNSSEYGKMLENRQRLPAWKLKSTIVDLIENNDVVLITGETGSGKSTQVVQFVLDYLYQEKGPSHRTKIICTQPRRISAIGLAERVAQERCDDVGEEVGYVIRGVNKTKPLTKIRFMTTGVLVRILQGSRAFLEDSIVVIDEVHERSVDTDLIVILLGNLIKKIRGLKIILMSATVSVDIFTSFFKGLKSCHIEGRTFPIQDFYLEEILEQLDFKIRRKKLTNQFDEDNFDEYLKPSADSKFFTSGQINYELISQLTQHVHDKLKAENNQGSILIFLPGTGEINTCCKTLQSSLIAGSLVVLPLHSALTPEEQKSVFKHFRGKRKIVVSTNIAETSITIDDCVATIDSGRVKTMVYNPDDNTTRLVESFVSKAEAKQRRGRAGRVRAGYSYKLFSKTVYDGMQSLPLPEIKRVALESLYLSVKSMGIQDVVKFLSKGLDPPPLKSLQKSQQVLSAAGLLTEDSNELTELGRFISMMPVMDHKHGKLLILSLIFGCLDKGVMLAAILGAAGSLFTYTQQNRNKIKEICSLRGSDGDLLCMVDIMGEYVNIGPSKDKRVFASKHCMSFNGVQEILSSRTQLYSILKDVGFLPMAYKANYSGYLNRNDDNRDVIKCVMTGAFYPKVARVQLPDPKFLSTSSGAIEKDPDAKLTKYWIRNEAYIDGLCASEEAPEVVNDRFPATRAFLHPSSVFFANNSENGLPLAEFTSEIEVKSVTSDRVRLKAPFAIFNGSQLTSKLFLRDITPTSTIALLLFGGPIHYDLIGSSHSPGMVIDHWLPIRTWCKNGVLIKELRFLLDQVVKSKLENPEYASGSTSHEGDDVLKLVETLVKVEAS
ncbi:LAMI_0A01530g1_1 [Lachancea mirantina]|uniref:LAMI_0A01530g1_1 n=1 Tax=Lachancea mirantina TaxID=1230905 RepID=A0A1G4ILY4_9SACH|nr:LAMI_0A01530g1_1 [Lachancea mirantina]